VGGEAGPTITLSHAQDDKSVEEAGRDGIAHIFIEPGRQEMGRDETEEDEAPVGPDERQYKLTIYRGGLNAVGYDLTVRKLGRVWVIKECRFVWVS
jgi:hypothetical protein